MEGFSMLYAVFLFFITIAVDIAYVYYVRRTGEGKALSAASTGALITFLAAIMVVSYTEDRLYIVPVVLGSFVGTFIAIKIDTRPRPHK